MPKNSINNLIESMHSSTMHFLKLVVENISSNTFTVDEVRGLQTHLTEITVRHYGVGFDHPTSPRPSERRTTSS